MALYQKIHVEEVIPDWLRANLLVLPDSTIINNATSNFQKKPSALVLLDNKYAISGVTDIEVQRSRQNDSNTAKITMLNIDTRYSGPNKHKVLSNVPVSIYFGYEDKYLQKYEGFIDTVSMTTNSLGSTITINCRDRAKKFIEDKISAGVYAKTSEYLGESDWHFEMKRRTDGTLYKAAKDWKVSEILIDVCYIMGLKDVTERVSIIETELPNGTYSYTRSVEFRPEFLLNIDPKWDRVLVANFIEECPLDILSKLCQSILHEVLFDIDGRLLVRPVQKANVPAKFFFKEERDLTSITENNNDDNVVNIITVVGQTANETSIIYPFAPVAVSENITVEKGQDVYGQAIMYPNIVCFESVNSIYHHMIQAPVIYPNGLLFENAVDNPENKPQFDIRIKYPNFTNGYDKQLVLDATCPIVTDTADWAKVGNKRRWFFHGAIDQAVVFETQPIMLKDRFGKTMVVICKERSVNEDLIKQCGNIPFKPHVKKEDPDPSKPPEPLPTELAGWEVSTDGVSKLTSIEIPEGTVPSDFTPIYQGNSMYPSLLPGVEILFGWENFDGEVPSNVPLLPKTTVASIKANGFRLRGFSVNKYDTSDPFDDQFTFFTMYECAVFYKCTKSLAIQEFMDTITGATIEIVDPGWSWIDYDSIQVMPSIVYDPNSLCSNCSVSINTTTQDGKYGLTVPYPTSLPSGNWQLVSNKTITITYPAVTTAETASEMSTGFWQSYIWSTSLDAAVKAIKSSPNCHIKVANSILKQGYYSYANDPDTNCIYWKWKGGYKRELIENKKTKKSKNPDNLVGLGLITYTDGADWEGNVRELITKTEFYKLAQDPNVTVLEIVTAGLDFKSSGELVEMTELYIDAVGHNYYGNMEDEFKALMDAIEKMFKIVGAALMFLAFCILKINPGAPAGVAAILMALLGLYMILADLGDSIGSNVSKVMEDLTGRATSIRREEIHLNHNAAQAATWRITNGYNYNTGEWYSTQGNMQYKTFSYIDDNNKNASVFIMDLTKPNTNGVAFPQGCWVTSFGWETPEIGDRDISTYYKDGKEGKKISYTFSIEGFGDDEDQGWSAEYLLSKRFCRSYEVNGRAREPDDTWDNSVGYEVLVDRSMTEVSITDHGLWWDFFERREDFQPRLYKYIAVIIYDKVGASQVPRNSDIFGCLEGTETIARWGFWVSRGLNAAWYSRYRWLENKTEQNYLGFKILYAGQSQTVTHIINNFKYSKVMADVRIWGKAYGKFAPTIIYYKETDQLSMNTYGRREKRLENNCINDYKLAKYIANCLASMSTTTYSFESTGKPHLKEGDIVHIKEETTGAAAGMFRTWENTFKAPDTRECTMPANMLTTQKILGILNPSCSCPTTGNNVLVGCGSQNGASRLVELDKSSNPIWYTESTGRGTPTFVMRWGGYSPTHANLTTQQITIVGIKETCCVHLIDYAVSTQMKTFFLPGEVLCGAMDEEQRYLWVGHTAGVSCIDLYAMDIKFTFGGRANGIGVGAWKVYDKYTRNYAYLNCGVVFVLQGDTIYAYQNFNDDKTDIGNYLGSYSTGLSMATSLEYKKSMNEIVVVGDSVIKGIDVEVGCDVQYPELGIDVEFIQDLWTIDFMNDAELVAKYPSSSSRKSYIDRFFKPVHAIRDITRDLIISDSVNNKVYKVNPSGKFYIVKISDGYTVADNRTTYVNKIDAVTIDAAMPLQLTNFGKNFVQEKTEEQIEAESSIGMGKIVAIKPKSRYLVKLLTSDTVVEAYNNSEDDSLKVGDTVVIGYGIGGGGKCAILAKKSLWDWTTETGEPYISTDATKIDVTKYGQNLKGSTTTTSADYSLLSTKIRQLERRISLLAGHHGITW